MAPYARSTLIEAPLFGNDPFHRSKSHATTMRAPAVSHGEILLACKFLRCSALARPNTIQAAEEDALGKGDATCASGFSTFHNPK
jgi:hypothetical protein